MLRANVEEKPKLCIHQRTLSGKESDDPVFCVLTESLILVSLSQPDYQKLYALIQTNNRRKKTNV